MKVTFLPFDAENMSALLEGRKSQTRRSVKPQPVGDQVFAPEPDAPRQAFQWCRSDRTDAADIESRICPYGQPGDLIWCREAWCACHWLGGAVGYAYKADDPDKFIDSRGMPGDPWQSPTVMPRRASRLTLLLTDVRCETLAEISDEDGRDEGYEDAAAFLLGNWAMRHGPDDWVWALTFEVIHANVDDVLAEPQKFGVGA